MWMQNGRFVLYVVLDNPPMITNVEWVRAQWVLLALTLAAV